MGRGAIALIHSHLQISPLMPDLQPEIVHIAMWDTFKSERTGQAFSACSSCAQPFQNAEPHYLIEKEFERATLDDPPRLVYEVAVCETCIGELESAISPEACEQIARFYQQKVDLDRRAAKLLAHMRATKTLDLRDWIDRCMVTGAPIESLLRYRIIAHGFGQWMAMAAMPGLISAEALDVLLSGLSSASIQAGQAFAAQSLNIAPPGGRPVALV